MKRRSRLWLALNWFRVAWKFRAIPPWNARFIDVSGRPFTEREIRIGEELAKRLRQDAEEVHACES